ncbi:MAG: HlyD family efflux transporter periplasmic adaptor subunit [Gammaproteobacteria bacterium]|nr:HlyD family efflux transporter periplasmic adaptor subunit [Gammaproteobacteria bacterium]
MFRAEALARFSASPWQPPLLSKPISGPLFAGFAVFATAALVVFAATYEFARKEMATGHLTPVGGWSQVRAQWSAIVRHRLVEAGSIVEAGDVLYELGSGDGLEAGTSVEGKLLDDIRQRRAALEAQLPIIEARARNGLALKEGERAAAVQQVRHLESEIRSLESRRAIARQQHLRGRSLRSRGALSESEAMELADRVETLSALIAVPRRELVRLQSALQSHQEQVHQLELSRRQEENAVLERIHALAMEESRLRARESGTVLAPRAGRVASVRAGPGDWVAPGDALLDILPADAELKARLFVSSLGIGAIETGQAVRVYLDAFPYEQHGAQHGQVLSISETTLEERQRPTATSPSAAMFRIDVGFPEGFRLLPAQRRSLRPGMTVSADLVRDYGTLVDWLLEPLRGAAKRL